MIEPDRQPAESNETFDRERVLALLDRLERDIAVVEAAMAHVEAGEHDSYAAAMTVLEPRPD